MRRALVIVVVAVLASPAQAELAKRSEGKRNAILLLAGLNIGGAHIPGDTGFLLGAEVSVPFVRFSEGYFDREDAPYFHMPGGPIWAGVYTDVLRDFAADSTRFSFGPEAGYGPLGIDGGLVIQRGAADLSGWCVRPVLTVSLITLYFRYGQLSNDTTDISFQEFGLLLKWGPKLATW